MIKWWKNLKVGIQTALIGLFGILLIYLLQNIPDLAKSTLPPMEIPKIELRGTSVFTATSNSKVYSLISPSCWLIKNETNSDKYGEQASAEHLLYFVVQAKESIVINKIYLETISKPFESI